MRYLVLSAALLFGLPLGAQSWEALRGLTPGTAARVRESGGREYKGKLKLVSDDTISLETSKGAVSVEQTRVRRVQVRSTPRRVRRVVMAASGATTDLTLGARFRNELYEPAGARPLTYVVPMAASGALAGAFPAYRTVYEVR